MNQFEKEYYEAESFWEKEMVQDPANIERIRRTVDSIPKDVKSLIDVGCGNGVFVNYLATIRPDLSLTGTDRSSTALKFVKVNKVESDITELSFGDSSYDCVSCLEVIEHLSVISYKKALGQLARISNKYLIISVPYNENLEESYTKCPSCKSIFNYQLHLRSYKEEDMKNLMSEFGFTCKHIEKFGLIENYVGHRLYTKIVDPRQLYAWKSPICPICGYADNVSQESSSISVANTQPHTPGIISKLLKPLKLLWPKDKQFYWILAVYEK